jgi:hypothetical protein
MWIEQAPWSKPENAAARSRASCRLCAPPPARAGFAAQLAHDLDHLRRAGGAHGWPLASSPPDGLIGTRPPMLVAPLWSSAAPSPRGQNPNAS